MGSGLHALAKFSGRCISEEVKTKNECVAVNPNQSVRDKPGQRAKKEKKKRQTKESRKENIAQLSNIFIP